MSKHVPFSYLTALARAKRRGPSLLLKAKGTARGGKYLKRTWNAKKNKGKGGWDYHYKHEGEHHKKKRAAAKKPPQQLDLFGEPAAEEAPEQAPARPPTFAERMDAARQRGHHPMADRKGRPVEPGDRVRISMYPRGEAVGTVVVSDRTMDVRGSGEERMALVVDVDGKLMSMPGESKVTKLTVPEPPKKFTPQVGTPEAERARWLDSQPISPPEGHSSWLTVDPYQINSWYEVRKEIEEQQQLAEQHRLRDEARKRNAEAAQPWRADSWDVVAAAKALPRFEFIAQFVARQTRTPEGRELTGNMQVEYLGDWSYGFADMDESFSVPTSADKLFDVIRRTKLNVYVKEAEQLREEVHAAEAAEEAEVERLTREHEEQTIRAAEGSLVDHAKEEAAKPKMTHEQLMEMARLGGRIASDTVEAQRAKMELIRLANEHIGTAIGTSLPYLEEFERVQGARNRETIDKLGADGDDTGAAAPKAGAAHSDAELEAAGGKLWEKHGKRRMYFNAKITGLHRFVKVWYDLNTAEWGTRGAEKQGLRHDAIAKDMEAHVAKHKKGPAQLGGEDVPGGMQPVDKQAEAEAGFERMPEPTAGAASSSVEDDVRARVTAEMAAEWAERDSRAREVTVAENAPPGGWSEADKVADPKRAERQARWRKDMLERKVRLELGKRIVFPAVGATITVDGKQFRIKSIDDSGDHNRRVSIELVKKGRAKYTTHELLVWPSGQIDKWVPGKRTGAGSRPEQTHSIEGVHYTNDEHPFHARAADAKERRAEKKKKRAEEEAQRKYEEAQEKKRKKAEEKQRKAEERAKARAAEAELARQKAEHTKAGAAIPPDGTPRGEAMKERAERDAFGERSSSFEAFGKKQLFSAKHEASFRDVVSALSSVDADLLFTRKALNKARPSKVAGRVADDAINPLLGLMLHYSEKKFPAKPMDHSKQRLRSNREGDYAGVRGQHEVSEEDSRRGYHAAHEAMREVFDNAGAELWSDDPRITQQKIADALWKRAPAAGSGDYLRDQAEQRKLGDVDIAKRYYLAKMYNAIRGQTGFGRVAKGHPLRQANEFVKKLKGTLDDKPEGTTHAEHMKPYVEAILEGKSLNKAFNAVDKKKGFGLDLRDVYDTAVMRRQGPPSRVVGSTHEERGRNAETLLKSQANDGTIAGVDYGNWVTDEERAHHLKSFIDSMDDLMDVCGLPTKMAGYNGKLGIAFGARGKAGALAHYEPGADIINLTRLKGAGSLAHEWGHFLDFAAGKQDGAQRGRALSSKPMGEVPVVRQAAQAVMGSEAMAGFKARLRKALEDHPRIDKKEYAYWESSEEVWARCFERHVQRKLHKAGRENTYLVAVKKGHYGEDGLWPTDAEVDAMAPHFDRFFQTFAKSDLLHKMLGHTGEPMRKATKGSRKSGAKYLSRRPDGHGGWAYNYGTADQHRSGHEKIKVGPKRSFRIKTRETAAQREASGGKQGAVGVREGEHFGDFAMHREDGQYKVTHKPSGMSVASAHLKGEALALLHHHGSNDEAIAPHNKPATEHKAPFSEPSRDDAKKLREHGNKFGHEIDHKDAYGWRHHEHKDYTGTVGGKGAQEAKAGARSGQIRADKARRKYRIELSPTAGADEGLQQITDHYLHKFSGHREGVPAGPVRRLSRGERSMALEAIAQAHAEVFGGNKAEAKMRAESLLTKIQKKQTAEEKAATKKANAAGRAAATKPSVAQQDQHDAAKKRNADDAAKKLRHDNALATMRDLGVKLVRGGFELKATMNEAKRNRAIKAARAAGWNVRVKSIGPSGYAHRLYPPSGTKLPAEPKPKAAPKAKKPKAAPEGQLDLFGTKKAQVVDAAETVAYLRKHVRTR